MGERLLKAKEKLRKAVESGASTSIECLDGYRLSARRTGGNEFASLAASALTPSQEGGAIALSSVLNRTSQSTSGFALRSVGATTFSINDLRAVRRQLRRRVWLIFG